MLSWRLPRIQNLTPQQQWSEISLGGSKCPQCDTRLPWYRLIPIVSWLLSRGQCHQCQSPIPIRYPLIELISASLVALAVMFFGFEWQAMWASLFFLTLLTISVIDLEHQLILDLLSLPLLWLGLLLNSFGLFTTADQAILGAVFGYLSLWIVFHSYQWLTGKQGMGYGDFKLLAAIGAWLGVYALPQVILIAASSGLILAFTLMLFNKHNLQSKLAFGPYLSIAAIMTLILGDQWVMNLMIEWL